MALEGYCKNSNRKEGGHCNSLDFLGYTFRPRSARNQRGELFVSFIPSISQKYAKKIAVDSKARVDAEYTYAPEVECAGGLYKPVIPV